MKSALVLSKGIIKIPQLTSFFPEFDNIVFGKGAGKYDCVMGWGFKKTATRARRYAASQSVSYIAIEDGFIRSRGLGVEGSPPLSLVVDPVGIYYDARQPSLLEQLIVQGSEFPEAFQDRVQSCMSSIRKHRLSKYNQLSHNGSLMDENPRVVVIDQTMGDASVEGAMACRDDFIVMLRSALKEHPDQTIWLKVHPDVICGKKKGYLYPVPIADPRIRVYAEPINPWDFMDAAEHVYTVSSLMGFEALLAGCRITCFGMPFYAGWGLTTDTKTCERRGLPRTLEQVFAAAYLQYARYVDPCTGKPCELEQIISYLADIGTHNPSKNKSRMPEGNTQQMVLKTKAKLYIRTLASKFREIIRI